MIANQWYAILESSEVKGGKPVGVTRMGEKLVAWRDSQGQVTVMGDKCPHRGVALSVGKLKGDVMFTARKRQDGSPLHARGRGCEDQSGN